MTLIRIAANKTLKGHKLLLLSIVQLPQGYVDELRQQFPDLEITVHVVSFGEKNIQDKVSDAEWKDVTILLTGSCLPDPDKAPKMQYIQLQSAGVNHIINHPMFKDTDVAFCTANGIHGPQISEWVISTFLAFQHRIPVYLEQQRQAKWRKINEGGTEDAVGLRVGILGYGSIGRQTARVATAMGMDVHAYTLHPRPTPESRRDDSYAPPGLGDPDGSFPRKWFSGETTEELHEFLGSGLDLVVVAMPLTDKTRGMIGKKEFEVLSKKKAFVSNIARGPIVNTDDLMEALDKDVIRGAAVDVTDPEPLPDGHPLWSARNIIITPHVSGGSKAYVKRISEILRLNLERLSEGKELINKVNRKDGY